MGSRGNLVQFFTVINVKLKFREIIPILFACFIPKLYH